MTKLELEIKIKEYVARVEYNSKTTDTEVKDRINTAVRDIVALGFLFPNKGVKFRFGGNKKVNLILMKMKKDIELIIKKGVKKSSHISNRLNLSLGLKTQAWDTDSWVSSERYNKTYLQRLGVYSNRLKHELEIYTAVGMVNKMSQLEITNWFMLNIQSPHTVPEILDAHGYDAVRASGVLSVGVGGIYSAYKSILRLNHDMIMTGYAISNNKTWGKNGLFKYVLVVNDAKTCTACQMNIGVIFPAGEFVVPQHLNCRCKEVIIME